MWLRLRPLCSFLLYNRPKRTSSSSSSAAWLKRQRTDPYVRRAKLEHYRCRSAFKLLEINQRHPFLKAGMSVLDCGAAPGSWTEVLVKLVNANGADGTLPKGRVFAMDRSWMAPVSGATIIPEMDLLNPSCPTQLYRQINDSLDAVVCDAAPSATGASSVDHERIVDLCLRCLTLIPRFFRPNSGVFICKLWQGFRQAELADEIKRHFHIFRILKPSASRKESAELYFMSERFKGSHA